MQNPNLDSPGPGMGRSALTGFVFGVGRFIETLLLALFAFEIFIVVALARSGGYRGDGPRQLRGFASFLAFVSTVAHLAGIVYGSYLLIGYTFGAAVAEQVAHYVGLGIGCIILLIILVFS